MTIKKEHIRVCGNDCSSSDFCGYKNPSGTKMTTKKFLKDIMEYLKERYKSNNIEIMEEIDGCTSTATGVIFTDENEEELIYKVIILHC